MPSTQSHSRLPRYRRKPESIRNFHWTPRDLEILLTLHRHQLLRTTHFVQLLDGYSHQNTKRRLQILFHHGFIGRRIDDAPGNSPSIYCRTDKGERILLEQCLISHPLLCWRKTNPTKKGYFDDHTLFISDIMVAIECACRLHPEVEFIRPEEILADMPAGKKKRHRNLQWSVTVSDGFWTTTHTIIPDGLFGLHFLNQSEENNRAYFFLEADRATMDDGRFYEKMVAYHETWRQKIHEADLGLNRFRVLTVTTSPERVANFIEKNKQLNGGKGSGLFLFTDAKSLADHNDILTLPLRYGNSDWTTQLFEH